MTSSTDKYDAAGLLAKLDNLVLLGKRSKICANLSGFWSLPCGAVEKGEIPLEACKREFAEETGIIIKNEIHYLNSFKMKNGGTFYAYFTNIRTLIFPSNEAKDSDEHEEWGFFKIEENCLPFPMTKETRETILKLK
jgi:8-oxo-dGTP diphosphatase